MSEKLAVIMSVYEGDTADNLNKALESILKQTYTNFYFYIFVDGPISVECSELLKKKQRVDNRIQVFFSENNSGLASGLNFLIEKALSKIEVNLILRMDADDISFPNRIEEQVRFSQEHPDVDVFGSECIEINEDNGSEFHKTMDGDHITIKREFVKKTPFVHPTVVFRRRIFDLGYRYRTDTHFSEDLFLWIELMKAGFTFGNIQKPLLYFRTSDQMLRRRSGMKKALTELTARFYIMKELNLMSFKNAIYCGIHFVVKLLPLPLLKLAYQTLR